LYYGYFDTDSWTYLTTLVNPTDSTTYAWSYSWTPAAEGVYDLKAIATDGVGNVESTGYAMNITYDVTAPYGEVTIANDYYGPNTIDAYSINGTAGDGLAGVDKVGIYLQRLSDGRYWDGGAWRIAATLLKVQTTDDLATWNYDGTSVFFQNNVMYSVEVLVTDKAGNSAWGKSDSFIWDRRAPDAEITTPVNGDYVKDTINICGTVVENESGILDDEIRVRVREDRDGSEGPIEFEAWPTVDASGNWCTNLDTTTLTGGNYTDGLYLVRVMVKDNVYNTGWDTEFGIMVDNTSPYISDLPDDINVNEGDYLDLATFVPGLVVKDEIALSRLYVSLSFVGVHDEMVNTPYMSFDISDAGTYWMVSEQEILDYLGKTLIPMYTAILPEGTYDFSYYVKDMAGNRSTCIVPDADPKIAAFVFEPSYEDCHLIVTVNNVAPSVEFASDQTIYEGDYATFTGSFTDPSAMDLGIEPFDESDPALISTLSEVSALATTEVVDPVIEAYFDDMQWFATIDYGDGTVDSLGYYYEPQEIVIPDHQYILPVGVEEQDYLVTLTVTEGSEDVVDDIFELFGAVETHIDGEGASTTATVVVTVKNLAPTVTISANPGPSVWEGTPITLTANVVSGNAPYTYQWGGACSGTDQTAVLPMIPAGSYTCNVEVTDSDGDTASAEATVSSSNLAPAVIIYANPGSYTVNNPITLTAVVTSGNTPYISQYWTADCIGGTGNTFTLTTPGTYVCGYVAVDSDGDSAAASVSVTIAASATGNAGETGEVEGTSTSTEETTEENEEGEVLGEMTCDAKSTLSGFVYVDANKNGSKDEGENGMGEVDVVIYIIEDGEEKVVKTVTTDSDGAWEAQLCPADYMIRIDQDTLAGNIKLASEDSLSISVLEGADKADVNIALVSEMSLWAKYWWLILLAILALVGGGAIYLRKSMSKE